MAHSQCNMCLEWMGGEGFVWGNACPNGYDKFLPIKDDWRFVISTIIQSYLGFIFSIMHAFCSATREIFREKEWAAVFYQKYKTHTAHILNWFENDLVISLANYQRGFWLQNDKLKIENVKKCIFMQMYELNVYKFQSTLAIPL
jgi:hypothetical protein